MVPQPLSGPFPDVKPNNKIDELVFAKLKRLGIPPSPPCTDEVFLRRVYLDATGVLPTPDEVRAFLADGDPQKRSKLIDRLLERDEFADFWALKWGDLLRIKSEYPVRVWPRAVMTYYQWVRDSIAQNKPYDQFVRELLTSSGSNFRDGPSNYYRAVSNKDPQSFAEMTALVFMGARLGCARCHGHPTEKWTLDDNMGMAAFFSKVGFKATNEWKEEIVFFNPKGGLWSPQKEGRRQAEVAGRRSLGSAPAGRPARPLCRVAHRGRESLVRPKRRQSGLVLAVGAGNRSRARRPAADEPAGESRVARLPGPAVGRQQVRSEAHLPPDPQLEDLPVVQFVEPEQQGRHEPFFPLLRAAFGSGAASGRDQPGDADARRLFPATFPCRERFCRRASGPRRFRTRDIPSRFLDLFGRASRDRGYEADRTCELSLRQALYRISSNEMRDKVAGSQRVQRFLQGNKPDAEIVEEIYLATLSRPPRDEEKKTTLEYLATNKNARPEAIQDVLWAVLNTKECMFNH